MIGFTILLSAFLLGGAAGSVLLLRIGCAQEGRTLHAGPPGPVAATARRMAGLHVQAPSTQARPGDEHP